MKLQLDEGSKASPGDHARQYELALVSGGSGVFTHHICLVSPDTARCTHCGEVENLQITFRLALEIITPNTGSEIWMTIL